MVSSSTPDPTFPVLAQAGVSVRYVDSRVAELPHVVNRISQLLDVSLVLTPAQAAANNSSRLLERVLSRIMTDPTIDPAFRSYWLAQALEIAIKKNNFVLVRQIHGWRQGRLYVPSLKLALQYGSLDLVRWIVENRSDRLCCEPGLDNLCFKCFGKQIPTTFDGPNPERVLTWLLSVNVPIDQLFDVDEGLRHVEMLNALGLLDKINLANSLELMIHHDRANADVVRFLIDRGVSISREVLIPVLCLGAVQSILHEVIDVVVTSPLCDSLRDKFTWGPTRFDGTKSTSVGYNLYENDTCLSLLLLDDWRPHE